MGKGALDQITEEHAQAGVEGPDCLSPGRSRTVGTVPGESHGNRVGLRENLIIIGEGEACLVVYCYH